MSKGFLWIAGAIVLAVVQIALIIGKLIGDIGWSWWWVMSPLWAPSLIVIVIIVVMIALFAGASSRGENPFQ
jgi:uncharacterized membrane protein YhaH (DUF805 family)